MLQALKKKKEQRKLEETIQKIQQGDDHLRNELIEQYTPFIVKEMNATFNQSLDYKHEDEYTIALMAFNEAINTYRKEKNSSFLSFASLVIKRRIIDEIRKKTKGAGIQSIHYGEEESNHPYEIEKSKEIFQRETEQKESELEIKDLAKELKEFDIMFSDLVKSNPKHQETKRMNIELARIVLKQENLLHSLKEKRKLPVKELSQQSGIPVKTIEKNRKYIISLIIITSGDYEHLKGYLKGVGL